MQSSFQSGISRALKADFRQSKSSPTLPTRLVAQLSMDYDVLPRVPVSRVPNSFLKACRNHRAGSP